MRPALIGEAPGRSAGPVLGGRAGRVLCDLAGWECDDAGDELASRFFVANLLDEWPGQAGKGTAWPRELAKSRATLMRGSLSGRVAVVLLGLRVAHAFDVRISAWGAWRVADANIPASHTVIPHPSGINRALNDPEVRRAAGQALRKAVQLEEE